MKTILHVSDWANGGLATYLYNVIKEQKKYSHVKLLASKEMSEARLTEDDSFLPLISYTRTPMGIYKAIKQTREYIQTIKPDILFIHSSFAGVFARLATIKLKDKPTTIYCAHGWSFLMHSSKLKHFLYEKIEYYLAKLSDTIIVISKNELQAALNIGIDSTKLHLIYHGIPTDKDTLNSNFKDSNTFKSESIHILFLGRYDYAKGFDWLMEFIEKHPIQNITWHIAGKNIVDKEIYIHKEVINHGWIEHKDIGQLLLRCDAVIIPSRWEGFGLSAIEAMKYAKPLFVSYGGALPELVKQDYNGILFHLNNPKKLITFLKNIDIDKLRIWGINGYQSFIENYTDDKMLSNINKLKVK